MITREPGRPTRARVIGSLTGDTVHVVLDAVSDGVTVLDLSDLRQLDDRALRALAELSSGRCALVACPRWLELWLARVRQNEAG